MLYNEIGIDTDWTLLTATPLANNIYCKRTGNIGWVRGTCPNSSGNIGVLPNDCKPYASFYATLYTNTTNYAMISFSSNGSLRSYSTTNVNFMIPFAIN